MKTFFLMNETAENVRFSTRAKEKLNHVHAELFFLADTKFVTKRSTKVYV